MLLLAPLAIGLTRRRPATADNFSFPKGFSDLNPVRQRATDDSILRPRDDDRFPECGEWNDPLARFVEEREENPEVSFHIASAIEPTKVRKNR